MSKSILLTALLANVPVIVIVPVSPRYRFVCFSLLCTRAKPVPRAFSIAANMILAES